MEILAHRGYWNNNLKSNSFESLIKALKEGFGFESDIRDYNGELVISHNIADSSSFKISDIFKELAKYKNNYCFAINIKSDGLKDLLFDELNKYGIENYFTFDMSIPQMIEYREKKLKYFTRQSEYEKDPVLYKDSCGVWIDAFLEESWVTEKLLNNHIKNGKRVCLVSPDLHNREYLSFWRKLKSYEINFNKVMLCTDFPSEANRYFNFK